MTAQLEHVTVVFAGQSESWAKWIDHQIRAAGRRTTLVRWNPLRRPPTVQALGNLMSAPGRILLVIDDWYERLERSRFDAWAGVLRQTLPEYRDRIAAVSVTAQPMPDAVIALAPVELRGLRPEVARSRVLECAGVPAPGALIDLRRGPRFPDDPPEVWRRVPRRNRRFIGRTELLEQVYATLSAAGRDGATVALRGPGGFGKTQLAAEYVHRFAGEYDIVWWISAAQRVTARQQFAELAPEMGLTDAGDLAATIKAVRRELHDTARPWLLVLDGAGDPEPLRDLVPEGRGHVLVTTHRGEWAAHAETIEVPPFERRESVAFLRRRAARLTDDQAQRLAEAVEDMPLLLDQMAAWLDLNPTVAVNDYVRDIREGRPDRFGVMASGQYPKFEVAWAKLINSLREGSEPAWQLLNLLVCFSPDVVPVRLLQTARHGDLPPELAELISEPSSWNTALRKLSEITSMRIEYEQGPRRLDTQTVGTLRMHRLFHRYVRSVQAPDDAERYSAAARRVLVSADPRDSAQAGNWARYAEVIPHLEPSGALQSADDDVRDLVLNCVEYLRMRGEYHDGWWLSRLAVDNWRPKFGDTDRSVLVAVHQLANMLRRLGRYAEAEEVGRENLRRLSGAGQVRPIELIRAKDGLGGTLMALGRYTEARTLFEEAAASAAEELGGENVPRTLSIRSNLAVAVGLQGHYAESLVQHRRIFEARVELLGGKDAATLNSALRSAWMLRLLGRYREALAIQGHNSRVHSQVLDRNHSQTLHAEHNLALCARRDGDLQFAHVMMRGVREKLLRRRGALHPETLMVSCDYAMLLRQLERTAEARELAELTAAQYAAQLGEGHPYAIGARDNVATVMREMGETRSALELSLRTVQEMEQAVGREHPWAIGCAKNGVAVLAAAGETESAAALGRDAAERSARALGESHVLTISLRAGLALDLAELGEPEEAEALHGDAVTRLTTVLGPDHPQTHYILERHRPYWDFEPQPT